MADKKADAEKKPSAPDRPPARPTAVRATPGAVTAAFGAMPAVAELGNRATLSALRSQRAGASPGMPPSIGGGAPLDPTTRADMEHRFGADFSGVRVHGGQPGARLAAQHGARAFTVGHEIVFGKDQLAPSTTSGRHLIAHELAHVRQQQVGRTTGHVAGTTATEADADRAARDVVAGSHAEVREAAPPSIQMTVVEAPDVIAMSGRVAMNNDAGVVTGTLDGHKVVGGTAGETTMVGVGVYGNTVNYHVEETSPPVDFTDREFCLTKYPAWDFILTYRAGGERPGPGPLIIPGPKKPKPAPKRPKPPKPKEPEPEVIPANYPTKKEEEPKPPQRVEKLRTSMMLGADDLDQQLANMTDEELTELTVDERKQLLDWLTDTMERAKGNQDSMLRLLTSTPEPDARRLVDALRADDALLTRKMRESMDYEHQRALQQSLQLLYNTTLFKGLFTVEDLESTPIIPLKRKSSLLDSLDLDQLDIQDDGTIRIKPKLDAFGRDQPKPFKLDLFGPMAIETPDDPFRKKVKLGPGISLFGVDDPKLFDSMPQAELPFVNLFPYSPPKLPIVGKSDPFTDFITGPVPSKPVEQLSPDGKSQFDTIKKELDGWLPYGRKITNAFKDASPADRLLIAENIGDEGMTKLYDSLDPWHAAIIGSLAPLEQGKSMLLKKRLEVIVQASKFSGRARLSITSWLLGTMTDDDLRDLVDALDQQEFLKETLRPLPGMAEYLQKRGIDLDSYTTKKGVGTGSKRGTARLAESLTAPSEGMLDTYNDIPAPFGPQIAEAATKDLYDALTPGVAVRGIAGYMTFGVTDIPFGLYAAGESLVLGGIDIAHGDTGEGAEKIAPIALMIVAALITRKVGKMTAVGELGAAETTALEEEGLLGPKGPGQFSLKGYKGALSPEAAQVEAALKANPAMAAASGALVDELRGLANVEKAAGYMRGSSAATRLVVKRGLPGLKALVAAEGDVAAAEAALEGGAIPKVPAELPSAPKQLPAGAQPKGLLPPKSEPIPGVKRGYTGDWPPPEPGPRPTGAAATPEAMADYRYRRYLHQEYGKGVPPQALLTPEGYGSVARTVAKPGARPGRRGGKDQRAVREGPATDEGFADVEEVKLGTGINKKTGLPKANKVDGVRPNAAGAVDYLEVDDINQNGLPRADMRTKLKTEIQALKPGDTLEYWDKVDPSRRIKYVYGDSPAVVDTRKATALPRKPSASSKKK